MENRLLIVDDEEAILYAYKRLFGSPKNGGIIVDTARSLEEATRFLKQHKYKVVLTDLRLGIEDDQGGFRVIKYIKQFDENVKIILVTAYGNFQVEKTSIDLGADYYLEKPVPMDELKKILRELDMYQKSSD